MENDRLNIDKLFRENLSSREVPPNASDWADIEKSLNASDRSGGGIGGWVLGALIVLISAGAVFFMTHRPAAKQLSDESKTLSTSTSEKSDYPSQSTDNLANVNAISKDHSSSLNEQGNTTNETPNTIHGSASNDNDISSTTDNLASSASPSMSSQSSGETSSKKSDRNSSTSHPGVSALAGTGAHNKKPSHPDNKNRINNSPHKNTPPDQPKTDVLSNSADNHGSGESKVPSALTMDANNKNERNRASTDEQGNASDGRYSSEGISPFEMPLMKALQTRTGKFTLSEENLKFPNRIPAEDKLALTNWSAELSAFGGYTNSSIEERYDLLTKRNNEELNTFHWGVLLDAGYKKGRSQFGFGLGYEKTGENIQYSDEIIRQINYVTTEMQQIEYEVTIVDSVQLDDTTWIVFSIDTTYMDTTFIEVQNTKDTLVHDKEITSRNGITTIQQIFIPLSFRYDIFHFNDRAELFVSGTLQLDYALKRKASYLDEETRRLKDIRDFTTYRSINSSASLGLGVRLRHTDRFMTVVELYGRRNLFSWNSDFGHRYSSFGLRLGVGYNF